ncbi:MAG: hypothetical protein AB8B80_01310 [Marinicellaceae bacterium]
MISKYTGVTLILLAVVSAIASWMIYNKYTNRFFVSSNNAYESRQLIKDIEIKPENFASLDVMKNVVKALSKEPIINQNSVSLAYSPVENEEKRPLITIPTDAEKQRRIAASICRQARNLTVSMSFVSENEEYAVIADKFVRVGQTMANKFKVLKIEPNKVQVQKQGIKCDIKVNVANVSQL